MYLLSLEGLNPNERFLLYTTLNMQFHQRKFDVVIPQVPNPDAHK